MKDPNKFNRVMAFLYDVLKEDIDEMPSIFSSKNRRKIYAHLHETHPTGVTVRDLEEALSLPNSSIHHVIQVLEGLGLIEGRYSNDSREGKLGGRREMIWKLVVV